MQKRITICHTMHLLGCTLFFMAANNVTFAQNNHVPPLTQKMVENYISVYQTLLDIKLDKHQQESIQTGLTLYWKTNNKAAIQQTLSDLTYFGKKEELQGLRNSSQSVFVQAFRQDSTDTISKVFMEAFDKAHPDRIPATAAMVFADVIGVWKKTGGVLAERSYNGQPAGVAYTNSETIEISADGKFKRLLEHSHYSGSCSQIDGTTEYGTVTLTRNKLVFKVESGCRQVIDSCTPQLNQNVKLTSHIISLTCSIRTSLINSAVQTLCLSSMDGTSTCLTKNNP